MYNHFVCQLTDARLMDKNKKYVNSNINAAKCTITLFANSLMQDLWIKIKK